MEPINNQDWINTEANENFFREVFYSRIAKKNLTDMQFLKENVIDLVHLVSPDMLEAIQSDPGPYRFYLEKYQENEWYLKLGRSEIEEKNNAYYLPYMNGPDGWEKAQILVPRLPTRDLFVFTGSMQGCSLIICHHGDSLLLIHDNQPVENFEKIKQTYSDAILFRLDDAPNGLLFEERYLDSFYKPDATYGRIDAPLEYIDGCNFLYFDSTTENWFLITQNQGRYNNDLSRKDFLVKLDRKLGTTIINIFSKQRVENIH